MKKFLALLIISCMLMMALASCNWFGGDKSPEETKPQQTTQPTTQPDKPTPPACTEHKDEDGDYMCDACEYVMFEEVEYSLNLSDYAATSALESALISGRFTVSQGTELRARTKTFEGVEYTNTIRIGSSSNYIKISVPGTGKLTFLVENGSSSITTDQFTKITSPDGQEYDYSFANTGVVKLEIDVTEGDWIISRGKNGGTQYYYYFYLACMVAVAPENGFELVSEGKTEFLVGETLDTSGVRLNATYANGKTDPLALSDVTIDTSKVDMSKAGTYDVTISYKDYTPIIYKVNVYANEGLKLDFDAIEKLAQNSSAGNGVYFNQHFREVYAIGEALDTKGLSVTVSSGDKDFKVTDYTISGFDSTTAGAKTLTITYGELTETIVVYVVDTAIAEGNQVKVDKAYDGEIGAVVDGYNMFTTIHQALDYLARVPAAEKKLLVIGEGLFTEKLEIIIPNLTIRGSGADKTTIEWDSIYGQVDGGGFTHTTDSTQTVAIRESAVNCVIEDITISNYWNSQERMTEAKLGIERALALLVQADKFIMRDSALLGIQDTLELFTGRQYFENVFISGYTDFIFGTNNTTYFKNCTIHVIDTEKDDNGTAGYLTAFKGSNKGANDAIVYGAIFDGCKFTADEGVTEKQAIGRPWGAYAAVAVINSEIGGHISTAAYGATDSDGKAVDPRYTAMSGVLPTAETVQFVEYNNTGAGAITEAVAGMRMLTAEESAKYTNFAIIYGTTNGKITYLDPWDPTSSEVAVDDRDYYYFNGGSSATGTSHTFDTTTTITTGSTLEWDRLLISAENGKVAWNSNANALNMKAGAFIKFTVPAGTTVTIETYPNYNYFTLNGVGTASANMLSQYYAEETEVTLLSTGDLYLYSIIINPDEKAPEAPTLNEIKVEGMKVDYMIGEEISLAGVAVNAVYSDNSVLPLSDYTVNSSAVNTAEAGEYDVVFTIGETTITVKVTYIADLVIRETTTIDLTNTDVAIEKTTGNYKMLSIDATNGKFADNGSGWTQVNAGTIITLNVLEGAEVSVNAYNNETNKFDIVIVDGVCTITCNTNGYLGAITVKYTVVYSETTTIALTNIGTTIQGTTGEYEGLSIDATNGKFGDNGNWTQVNVGTIITLNVVEGAKVSVSAYTSADNFTIAIADGVCTITCNANDYLNAITVTVEQ